jgi:hypothetical protein
MSEKRPRTLGDLLRAMCDMSVEKEKEAQKDRQSFREAIDGGEGGLPMQLASLIVTGTDGKQLLVATTVIQPYGEAYDRGVESALEGLDDFVSTIILPVLKPDERATIRLHTFDAAFFAQNATEAIEGPALAARVRAFREEQERQEVLKKFRKCCACDDTDCERRITEPPPGHVAPESTPQP